MKYAARCEEEKTIESTRNAEDGTHAGLGRLRNCGLYVLRSRRRAKPQGRRSLSADIGQVEPRKNSNEEEKLKRGRSVTSETGTATALGRPCRWPEMANIKAGGANPIGSYSAVRDTLKSKQPHKRLSKSTATQL